MIGRTVGHYRILERLGGGGMGVVYKAEDTKLGRMVALKFLPPELMRDADAKSRFLREAHAASLLDHSNICAIHDIGETDDEQTFIAMACYDGETLKTKIERGPMPVDEVLKIAEQIARGLGKAHASGIVHRDVKPANVIVTDDGVAKILDFGLAKLAGATHITQSKATLGTLAYMAPEQLRGEEVGPQADLWSLGVVLFELLTGQRPFRGDYEQAIAYSILNEQSVSLLDLQPNAPCELERMVKKLLRKDPQQRYQTAEELLAELEALRVATETGRSPLTRRPVRRALTAAAVIALMMLVATGLWIQRRQAQERWLRREALPRLQDLAERVHVVQEGREGWDAWILARKIEEVSPGEPLVDRLRDKFAVELSIKSEPPGASVYARYYDEPEAAPILIGRTPIVKYAYPSAFTRIRLELEGKQPVDDVIWSYPLEGTHERTYRLHDVGSFPDEMSWVPAGPFFMMMPGLEHLSGRPLAEFLVDRHEVRNRDYKRFVDAGGYAQAKYWTEPFVDGDRTLTFEEATARFTDRTGRPGPSTWEVGSYPEGHDEHPVSGVSWYEAVAYAQWAGKRLPTLYHWNRLAFTVASSRIVPMANLLGKGSVPVGSTRSANRLGVSDLAGNAREWIWNATENGRARFILGGGWNDPDYAFVDAFAQPAFDRSETNGFRCIRIVGDEPDLATLQGPIDRRFRDFYAEKPVSDDVFAQYLRLFAYDKSPLEVKIEEERTTDSYVRQKVTFKAAYGGERMMAYLFLPVAGRVPYQTVVLFPGSGAIGARSSAELNPRRVDFLLKSGRAVVWPIYKSTYERSDDFVTDNPGDSTLYRDHVIMWGKDLSRTIDYLETRKDIDAGRLAYYGLSWGGAVGAIMPAVEPRIRVNILVVAGLCFPRPLPEADQLNYVGRVRQPTLILNGALDYYFPPETSQKPLFDLLGTPPEHKRRMVYPGGHSVPRTEMIRESLAWLDRYLGPVS